MDVTCIACGKSAKQPGFDRHREYWFRPPRGWVVAIVDYDGETGHAYSAKCAKVYSDKQHAKDEERYAKRPERRRELILTSVEAQPVDPLSINWPEGAMEAPPKTKPRRRTWLRKEPAWRWM